MPHVIVKIFPGRSEEQKKTLAERIVKDVVDSLGSREGSISVAIEEVAAADWLDRVYRPDIEPRLGNLYKKPGYGPSDL